MSEIKTLTDKERDTLKYKIKICSTGLTTNVDELSKYTKKTTENVVQINKINNLVAMITLFREAYYFETDKVVLVATRILSSIDFGEKNKDKNAERINIIVLSITDLCKYSNALNHSHTDKSTREKSAKLFAADYTQYVRNCTGQNDYKNSTKAPNIFNIAIKQIKTIFGKDRKEEIISTIEIPKFASDESVVVNIGQLTGNKAFDNCFLKILPYKVSLDGALFGHNVNWELKNTDTSPVSFTTTLRPKIETTQVDTPPIKPAVKAAEKPVEEKKVVAAPPVATPTTPAKKDVVEPSTPVEVDDDEPP